MTSWTLAWAAGLAFCAAACGGGAPPPREPPKQTPVSTESASAQPDVHPRPRITEVPPEVQQKQPDCHEEAREHCNALDDDCDGQIDEGCGYRSGALQITAAWNTDADVDLFVTGPDGEEVFFKKPHGKHGAHMDHDARGHCRREQRHRNVENIYWQERPPGGAYHVELRYWSPCGLGQQARARVSVAVEGKLLGTFERSLHREQRATVVRFELP